MVTKAHINHQGGTCFLSLMDEMERLMSWAERHDLSLKAEHISGAISLEVDWLSQGQLDQSEWRLHLCLFQAVCFRFGSPVLDLFAMPQNTQLPSFFSCFPTPGAEGHDAL